MNTTTTGHFTAWFANDPTCLPKNGICDVTVLEDVATSYETAEDGTETPVWSSQGDEMLPSTSLDAHYDDDVDFQKIAEDVLDTAGWTTVGSWTQTDTGGHITVERSS